MRFAPPNFKTWLRACCALWRWLVLLVVLICVDTNACPKLLPVLNNGLLRTFCHIGKSLLRNIICGCRQPGSINALLHVGIKLPIAPRFRLFVFPTRSWRSNARDLKQTALGCVYFSSFAFTWQISDRHSASQMLFELSHCSLYIRVARITSGRCLKDVWWHHFRTSAQMFVLQIDLNGEYIRSKRGEEQDPCLAAAASGWSTKNARAYPG